MPCLSASFRIKPADPGEPGYRGLGEAKKRDITRRQDNGASASSGQRSTTAGAQLQALSNKVEVLKRGREVRSHYGVGAPDDM